MLTTILEETHCLHGTLETVDQPHEGLLSPRGNSHRHTMQHGSACAELVLKVNTVL